MTNQIAGSIVDGIAWTQQAMLQLVQDMSDETLAKQPGETAPPMGWHIFHIARWADRLQASLPNRLPADSHPSELPDQIWLVENVAQAWGVDPNTLGWLETGPGMKVEDAVVVASVGRARLTAYAEKVFQATDDALKQLHDGDLTQERNRIIPGLEFDAESWTLTTTGPNVGSLFDDLDFHSGHASRHLGMVEALKGVMLPVRGTATV
ncbi:MAG: DinB family protein [Anaerolineae bacterium]|nr:DinB family protein [Anaerolineae bacterium]